MRHCAQCGAPIPHGRADCWSCGTSGAGTGATGTPMPAPAPVIPASGRSIARDDDHDSMFPPQPPDSQLVLRPPLPGDWQAETLPDGSERIRLSRWGRWNVQGGYVGSKATTGYAEFWKR